jgi:hypothetical protein
MSEVDKPGLRWFLTDASPREAQLALSYLVWPGEVPDPRLVDEWGAASGRRCRDWREFRVSPGYARAALTRHP